MRSSTLWKDHWGHSLVVSYDAHGAPHAAISLGTQDGVPRSLNLTGLGVRGLALALIDAFDLIAEALPGRCDCGEPIELADSDCIMCVLTSASERRQTMATARDGSVRDV